MRRLTVYYEPPNVCERYLQASLRLVRRLFTISEMRLVPIEKTADLTLAEYSSNPRVILLHDEIKTAYNPCMVLDGIGLKKENVALVRYQRARFTDTLYLMAHEVGHLYGMPHCTSSSCLMGVVPDNGRFTYVWAKMAERRKLSKRLFCQRCASFLNGAA